MLYPRPLPEDLAPPSRTPASLIDRLVAGDEDAFAELVRGHGPRLLAVASRYLPCKADAEDAVQEAYVNVVRYIHGFNRTSLLETWLHRIVVNCALMILRSRRRRPVLTNAQPETFAGMTSRAHGASVGLPIERLEHDEQRSLFRASLEGLPPMQRSVVHLRYANNLQVSAIANMLGVSAATVKTRLHRARRGLKHSIGAPARVKEAPEAAVGRMRASPP